MRLTTKLSMLMTTLILLAIALMFVSSISSFVYYSQKRMEHQLKAVATSVDQALLSNSPSEIVVWLPPVMRSLGIVELEILQGQDSSDIVSLPEDKPDDRTIMYRRTQMSLMQHPHISLKMIYVDPLMGSPRYLFSFLSVMVVMLVMSVAIFYAVRWLRRQMAGQERLEARAERILYGDSEVVPPGSGREWPVSASGALDKLLGDLMEAREAKGRVDTLIRAFVAQDAETGLNNRFFFDNQLATQLEDPESVGTHGVVMMVRLPDFDTLQGTHGYDSSLAEYCTALINQLALFVRRYPASLLARYHHSDLAVLLPHRSLKDADGVAAQMVRDAERLPAPSCIDKDDILHIGICAYRSGQRVDQVIENVEDATRHAVLQGGSGWCVFDRRVPEKGRGSVKWRTLLEDTLSRGGPRLYQKPAITREGWVHHYELSSRIDDGTQELLEAEYMPLVRQLGLTASYERLLVTRTLALIAGDADVALAIPITVDSLLQPSFLRWLCETLQQSAQEHRSRLLLELAEADVCQYLGRLRPVIAELTGLGCRLVVAQAGLTLVSSAYIKSLPVEVIKLHPGLVRSVDQHPENQLFIHSLTAACVGTKTRVCAVSVRTREEWLTLLDKGVRGGQGALFANSTPVGNTLKKYSQQFHV
ncbi:RNase E specificity factor CsrD [Lonsdalea populi]|uniref:RNase E specificity factor CsrD n=1 Tax=Lonsdalea populi TaxID=1172565 RepID=UPI000A1F394F|nr:RNase E specificity factor CsrD [Lonsdalea populi]OSN01904.1 RNase E specificity factor CsrD [Lonsdalea populi]QPQ24011.1 RNase E specificity factor CsrD [Lonsdalea populi]RAT46776.1 RNase E specificity factor CsrD [Lonsdalea populi]RAT47922.1 RNase E specificity factor CsrD [Lonsdalea populi]RAT58294.1 RNase E specificity factor CsrD [Lonsdalea populi]